jgi:hypothetical protein
MAAVRLSGDGDRAKLIYYREKAGGHRRPDSLNVTPAIVFPKEESNWSLKSPEGCRSTALRHLHQQGQTCYVHTMATEIVANLSPAYLSKRRAARYRLDVPLRVILHKQAATLIRDGRGTELSEIGMCVMASLELRVGEELEIEFTIPYSGEPIRVSGAVRNRNGYRYGCEFTPNGQGERDNVARLHQVLQTFAGTSS